MPKKKGETSYKETAFGIISRSKLIPLEIEGAKRAWDFVLEKSKNGKIPITSAFFKKIHDVGFGWIFPKMGGRFRKIEVQVSKHTPPKFYLISQLMEDFVRDLKARMNYLPTIEDTKFLDILVGLLAWAHHRFLWIHPFVDYNGRIGRLLINIILLNLNLPPIEMKAETDPGRKKYVPDHLTGFKFFQILKLLCEDANRFGPYNSHLLRALGMDRVRFKELIDEVYQYALGDAGDEGDDGYHQQLVAYLRYLYKL